MRPHDAGVGASGFLDTVVTYTLALQRSAVGTAKGIPSGICFVEGTEIATATGARAIEEIRVGQRVLSRGGTSGATAVDERTWRFVEVRMRNPDGSDDEIVLELLRPESWIQEAGANPGATILIELAEMGFIGPGRIVRVEACPPVESGAGEVVTATIRHLNGYVVELRFAESSEPLEVTGPHPLFSADRNEWVAAEELAVGERLVTLGGELTVTSVEQKSGVSRVWNLEVEDGHSYFAGADAVWAHNSCAQTAREVTASLSKELFKNLRCTDCAKAIVDGLKARGVGGQVLNIRARSGDFIVNDLVGTGTSITKNGFHQAVRVGEFVFDNFFPQGVAYSTYVNALNARGGVVIEALPF